jgi:hemerythrin superfamily protein
MKNNEYNDYAKDKFKALNDFLIDLIGALIPGIIFLFSITVCIIIPIIMIYITQDGTNVSEKFTAEGGASKLDLLVSNIFQGWFWIVIFFVFLILAYAIGNIFYRLDIKDVDRKSFKYMKKKHFETVVCPAFKDILSIKKWLMIKKWFLFGKKVNTKDNTKQEQEKKISEQEKKLLEKYFILLTDHMLSDEDRIYLKDKNKNDFKPIFDWLEKTGNGIDKLNKIACILYCNSKAKILQHGKLDDAIFAQLLTNHTIEDDTKSIVIKSLFEKIIINKLDDEKLNDDYICALGWFFLFSIRSEYACDKEDDCQFPYLHYRTFLTKRKEEHLMKHVDWCEDENSRSKNAFNKLKLRIQLIAPQEYNILVKNEAHIRMASSSWYVAKTNKIISGVSLILIIVFLIVSVLQLPNGCVSFKDFIVNLNNNIILLLPVSMWVLNFFIKNSVVEFLHYQRLREIFFVLQVYYEFYGFDGCRKEKRQ